MCKTFILQNMINHAKMISASDTLFHRELSIKQTFTNNKFPNLDNKEIRFSLNNFKINNISKFDINKNKDSIIFYSNH